MWGFSLSGGIFGLGARCGEDDCDGGSPLLQARHPIPEQRYYSITVCLSRGRCNDSRATGSALSHLALLIVVAGLFVYAGGGGIDDATQTFADERDEVFVGTTDRGMYRLQRFRGTRIWVTHNNTRIWDGQAGGFWVTGRSADFGLAWEVQGRLLSVFVYVGGFPSI